MVDFAYPHPKDKHPVLPGTLREYLERTFNARTRPMDDIYEEEKASASPETRFKYDELEKSKESLDRILVQRGQDPIMTSEDFSLELSPGITSNDVFGKILEYEKMKGFDYVGEESIFHQFVGRDNKRVSINYSFYDDLFPQALITVFY